MQLGTFDFSGFTPAANSRLLHPAGLIEDADALPWPDSARHAYGKNFVSQSGSAIASGRVIRGLRGSSLRELHNAVFDVIDGSVTSGTVRVGLGASVYGFVGRWVPRGLVAWMMGIRRVDELAAWQANGNWNGNGGSSGYGSPRSAVADGEGGSDSFVAVPPLEHAGEANVWKEG